MSVLNLFCQHFARRRFRLKTSTSCVSLAPSTCRPPTLPLIEPTGMLLSDSVQIRRLKNTTTQSKNEAKQETTGSVEETLPPVCDDSRKHFSRTDNSFTAPGRSFLLLFPFFVYKSVTVNVYGPPLRIKNDSHAAISVLMIYFEGAIISIYSNGSSVFCGKDS